MNIISSEFVKSSASYIQCPDNQLNEYAFIGRSNVGKSSLINMLVGRNNFAKISSKPGKTQLINHFLINEQFYFVDLPGYGYAKLPLKMQQNFRKMISDYILKRTNLTYLCLLIDSRLTPQNNDLNFLYQLGETGTPFVIIFTKADKQNAFQTKKNVQLFLDKVLENWEELPPYFITSSQTKAGKEEFLNFIEKTNQSLKDLGGF
ncbi:MAG: ribosome biogenesis GTP-binding protein YihA/YsxC [Bacteroidales bacterium]|jgi:GTP-binding protein|nr:ribosome biogenesis GTP-binding protein YihA/YsxC [Bacteroidales bacterium]